MAKGDLGKSLLAKRSYKDLEIEGMKVRVHRMNVMMGNRIGQYARPIEGEPGKTRIDTEAIFEKDPDLMPSFLVEVCRDPDHPEDEVFTLEQARQCDMEWCNEILKACFEISFPTPAEEADLKN
jgi:hypothetical protein